MFMTGIQESGSLTEEPGRATDPIAQKSHCWRLGTSITFHVSMKYAGIFKDHDVTVHGGL